MRQQQRHLNSTPTPYISSSLPKAFTMLSNPSPTPQTPSRHEDAKADSLEQPGHSGTWTIAGVRGDALPPLVG
ncbi:uncharacterized protein N7477_002374 [Penicillium maclennaniae]|uniref:uncharacterized protein n=1 Tax=Penicillium maclennaniae TaxID=1343394 RepID=UPI00253FB79E|nr:uncharacterized protein N7477_002374 [Penicillium maclennaniae]KAJ5676741.1 hypothetical protein N7477_002374 [Penicillium maclennaniae]